MNVKKRLKDYISYSKMSITQFEKSISTANGYVNSISRSMGIDKIEAIVVQYPDLNIKWLLTGEGEMLCHNLDYDIHTLTRYLYDHNEELMKNVVFREYIKSNIDILEIEKKQNELEEKKKLVKVALLQKLNRESK